MPEPNTETTVYTSRNFSINCGGVIHDPDKNLYLILANRVGASGDISYSYKLPKGRKTETEDLLATAIRESRRETGVATTSMALPPDLAEEDMDIDDDDEEIIPGEDMYTTEPIAITHSLWDEGSYTIMCLTFWFALQADSEIFPCQTLQEFGASNIRSVTTRRGQQRVKQRWPIWVTEDEALELLSKEDDKEVIKQMAGLLRVKKNWEQLRDERDY
ncbi:hypothetical protein D6D12_08027 [Aureobasidium pullulans]|uniref:Nudix hydrolase domain-containing protein n=1 Tax=Aureobasidium pullulans TaxID=5580 RepID=A0AB74JK27_AURPU|nr:hypothetical protein D6D11_10660 [Aureobasidium pullulans]THX23943.1 hypothetical protein D6D12_08027 [Aureobasidium pullulans]